MFQFVILLSAVACALGVAVPEGMLPQLDGRIVGGEDADISSYPWQISLQRSGYHSCGGSVYSENIIITAAHCLSGGVSPTILKIRAGSSEWNSGGSSIQVAAYKNHEDYSRGTMLNDIAVIRLASPLSFGSNVRNIPLASVAPPNGAASVVTGWGSRKAVLPKSAYTLQAVDVSIVSREVCSSSTYGYGKSIRDTMICAAAVDKDSCQGDSGGPLVSGGVLVGVVSWGKGCAAPKYPGVYSDVADLRSWVENAAVSV